MLRITSENRHFSEDGTTVEVCSVTIIHENIYLADSEQVHAIAKVTLPEDFCPFLEQFLLQVA